MWQRRATACRRQLGFQGDEVAMDDVLRFVNDLDISNDETHYAVVMDPGVENIVWRRADEAGKIL